MTYRYTMCCVPYYMWRPEVSFPNARDYKVTHRQLWTDTRTKTGRGLNVSAKCTAVHIHIRGLLPIVFSLKGR